MPIHEVFHEAIDTLPISDQQWVALLDELAHRAEKSKASESGRRHDRVCCRCCGVGGVGGSDGVVMWRLPTFPAWRQALGKEPHKLVAARLELKNNERLAGRHMAGVVPPKRLELHACLCSHVSRFSHLWAMAAAAEAAEAAAVVSQRSPERPV